MKKHANPKLALHRETLAALSPSEMHDVNGGTSIGPIIRATLRYCTVVTTVASHPIVGCK